MNRREEKSITLLGVWKKDFWLIKFLELRGFEIESNTVI